LPDFLYPAHPVYLVKIDKIKAKIKAISGFLILINLQKDITLDINLLNDIKEYYSKRNNLYEYTGENNERTQYNFGYI